MKNTIADLPKGPLDPYRKSATFDWKLLKLNIEGEDFVEFQVYRKRYYFNNIFEKFQFHFLNLEFLYVKYEYKKFHMFFVISENIVGFYEKDISISKT